MAKASKNTTSPTADETAVSGFIPPPAGGKMKVTPEKKEKFLSSVNRREINDASNVVWTAVFQVLESFFMRDGSTAECVSLLTGAQAGKVASSCVKAAERTLTKILSTDADEDSNPPAV